MSIKNFLHKQVYLPILHYYDLFQDLKRGINTRENCEITKFEDQLGMHFKNAIIIN